MPNFFRQVGLLLWKNFVIQRRKICVSIFEIILPVLFAALLLVVRIAIVATEIDTSTIYPSKNLMFSAGGGPNLPIYYAPNTTLINNVMDDYILELNNSAQFTSKGFPSEKALLDYYIIDANVTLAIVFNGVTSSDTTLPKSIRYSLRPKPATRRDWRTADNVPFVQNGGPRSGLPNYLQTNFIFHQVALDLAIIRSWNSSVNTSGLVFETQKMPYPPYIQDPMIFILQVNFPLLLCLSFMLNVVITTKTLILEKEKKLKESMKLMGLNNTAYWTSWFITVLIYLTVAMALYTILLGVSIAPKGPVLNNSNPLIFFIFLMAYGLSIISFSFLMAVIFDKANIGAAAAGILYFMSYVPYFFISTSYETMTRSQKLAACLLNNLGMSLGAYTIGLYEGTGEGVQWSNMADPATIDDNFSLLDAILLLLGDTVIYLIFVWYIDNVYPGEFGVAKPFYFPFTKSYWCGVSSQDFTRLEATNDNASHFEKEPTGVRAGISITNLKKEFKMAGKRKLAVDDLNLNVYDGQITVLLGHNGAGKTTTMSMLTGFISPTSGTAIVNGCDVTKDINGVRASLGLCPQHNVLFDTMTVDEHLEFFSLLKGGNRKTLKEDVTAMATEIGLETKRNTRSMHLSGGQKRKLCVGIALISGSKIVILDEPTSGMDPAARRQTWEILQRNRSSRTILLTTHFMDEADLLGDRIAIMSEGHVKCCGSSHFLKKLYGAGYHLVIVKSEGCNVSMVTQVVQQHIPAAFLESQLSAEISYLLPNEDSDKFAKLFAEIEDKKEKLGINHFGTSATTMEEVFLKVGEGVEDEDGVADVGNNVFKNPGYITDNGDTNNSNNQVNGVNGSSNIDIDSGDVLSFNRGFQRVSGFSLEMSRFYGMFVKKVIHTMRNKLVTIVQLLVPVLATCAALAIAEVQTDVAQEPSLSLDLSPFGSTSSMVAVTTATSGNDVMADKYETLFTSPHSITRLTSTQAQNVSTYFIEKGSELGVGVYNRRVLIGGEFSSDGSTNKATIHYNGQPYHSVAISTEFMMNALARYFTNDDTVNIQTDNYPLPIDAEDNSVASSFSNILFGFLIAFCLLFGMAFLSSSFVVFLIKERQVGAKHLQKVSGVGTLVYWFSNFAWDFINYLLPCLLILIVFAAFGTEAYISDSNLGYVFLSFLVYGLCILPYGYCLQYMFSTPATGVVVMIILNVFAGLVTLLAVFILSIEGLGTEDIAEILDWVFVVIFPQYNLGRCFMNIYSNYNNYDNCVKQNYPDICNFVSSHPCCSECVFCTKFTMDYLQIDEPGIGKHLMFMVIQGLLFFVITLMIEAQVPQKLWYKLQPVRSEVAAAPKSSLRMASSMSHHEDNDVTDEKTRVANMNLDNPKDSFILKDLYKRYGTFVAVDHISVGIPERECFGLLGQNGAGKTTTFKMLTGDVMVTSGNAYLEQNNIKNKLQKVQENLGYCPQFDALIDQMTGRETLYMYGRLRGVPGSHLKGVVNSLIDIMMLRKHADKKTGVYSGGNKRKLSTALALIGDPSFILLDEPSSGVDPRARRQLWNVLSKVRDSGKTLILTSHSMEECDALCTRIAIMVNGNFKCLGSPQHLKSKFGHGYTLICRMKTENGWTAEIEPLVKFITEKFPTAEVFDDHHGYAHFQIPDNDIPLAGIFETMEQSKEEYSVEDYSVHQTTLEQVFLTFTGKQIPPKEDKSGCFGNIKCC
ncbi:hypothetical protein LOTGIDRAFT_221435 [Lottia gigantea]|uniref:ABC transporter domain-containing protein n=1 Tax=Lottia gigantea TaxID=225164 RepID=V3ZW76_LOTGI|nr:hypothetical protein LOTGIDRAFT_221435 [Lottia gigantea]ESO85211.1 hypothetical protein LOTGIDRAFT_221435 [Lottia gigantea]